MLPNQSVIPITRCIKKETVKSKQYFEEEPEQEIKKKKRNNY